MTSAGNVLDIIYQDLDDDGILEAAVQTDEGDGMTAVSVLRETEGAVETVFSRTASRATLYQPDGALAIETDGIYWGWAGTEFAPYWDLIQRMGARAAPAGRAEIEFLRSLGHQDIDGEDVDVYRIDVGPYSGRERVIVLRQPEFQRPEGSSPYMIIDEMNWILASGASMPWPHVFEDFEGNARILEFAPGRLEEKRLEKPKTALAREMKKEVRHEN